MYHVGALQWILSPTRGLPSPVLLLPQPAPLLDAFVPAMAEALVVAGSILSIIQIVSRASELILNLRNLEPAKFDQVYWLFIAEKERTISWANLTRAAGNPIPPENVHQVEKLLMKMSYYYGLVNHELDKVWKVSGPMVPPASSHTG